ncbi:MAG: exo-alpha-sialidase [Thermoplasmata archaeon]|nr:exo-alpha-sialidase [Thermoplasmata archaeon]
MTKERSFIRIFSTLAITLLLSLSSTGCIDIFDDDDNDKDHKDELGFERENIQVQGSPQNTNEVTVAINPTDPLNIVAGANDYSTPLNDVWCGYYWSKDGGETWIRGFLPGYPGDLSVEGMISPLLGYSGTGDPCLAFDSKGNLYFAGIAFMRSFVGRSAIFVAKSTDGGVTWPSPDIRIMAQGEGGAAFHDKEWITVDLQNDYIYLAWAMFTGLSLANIMFSRSTDEGNTWSIMEPISEFTAMQFQNQGTALATDSEGTIHLTWIDFDSNQLQYLFSTDNGASFSTPESICEVHPIPYQLSNNTYRSPTLPALAIDPGSRNYKDSIYIAWNDHANGDADILLIYSRDKGRTWSEPIRVNQDPIQNRKDQFFPGLSVAPGGEVSVHFYDRREDANNTLLNIYYAVSRDGGNAFTDFRLTDESFDGNAGGGSWVGQQTGGNAFIGDYHCSASLKDRVYCFWCDTRNGDPDDRNSDVYMAYVCP